MLAAGATAQGQLSFPAVSNVARESPAVVGAGGTVAYRFTATPGAAGIESVRFHLRADKNDTVRTITTTDAASGRASAIMDAAWVSDTYKLVAISVRDQWARTTFYYPEGRVTSVPSTYYAGPATHLMDFAELGFGVAGTNTLPVRTDLTEFTLLTTAPATPGQTVRFRTTGTQGVVPIAQIVVTFTHVTNSSLTHAFTIDTTTPNGEWALPITAAMANGRYRLTSIVTYDREGRGVLYRGDGTAIESADGLSSFVTSQIFFSSVVFTVEGASPTAPGPQFTAWEREGPAEATPGSTLRFTFATQGGAFPVQHVSIRLTGPFGGTRTFEFDSADATFAMPVAADWISGPYNVTLVTLTDTAGRRFDYLPVGGSSPIGGAPGGSLPAPRERFTFSVRGGRDVGPYFVAQPEPATTLPAGRNFVTLYAVAVGFGTATYQWYRGEVGDTSQPLPSDSPAPSNSPSLTQLSPAITGTTTFWVRATVDGRTIDSNAARVMLRPRDFGRLTNLSILTHLTDANDSFTLGFVAGGSDTSGSKQILVRAAGPSLGALGVDGTLADPRIQLFRGATPTGENDNWEGAPALNAAMTAVGAFAYAGPTSRDAAALTTVTAGVNNSVRVSGSGSGRVIAELYDAGPSPVETVAAPRLLNVSVLKPLGSGLTVGFSIGGTSPVKVLVRAVGPTLAEAPFNIANAVADPRLQLYGGPTRIALNDNWVDSSTLSDAFSAVGAFRLSIASKDAVILITLSPGSYTAQVSSTGGSGVVLVEVYEVP